MKFNKALSLILILCDTMKLLKVWPKLSFNAFHQREEILSQTMSTLEYSFGL